MSPTLPVPRRLGTTLTWPAGVALTSWSYVWRTTPIHRRELPGSPEEDLPPPIPESLELTDVQLPQDGAGPLLHRTYRARIRDVKWTAGELMEHLTADPNLVAPLALARFHKERGRAWRMRVGDEFLVHMPGPWNGPVRTAEITPTSFRFLTLRRHLEAGQIQWSARDLDSPNELEFSIESWARAGDRLSDLLHNHLRMAKEVQLHMWTSVIEKVARRTGGRLTGGIDIETRRIEADYFEQGGVSALQRHAEPPHQPRPPA